MFGRDKEKAPAEFVELIDHKWLLEIMRAVATGPQRTRDLLRIDGAGEAVYAKTVNATLDHLRERGLVVCDTVRESPPIRQHRATPLGMQFLEILEGLVKFMEDNPELRPRYQRRKGS